MSMLSKLATYVAGVAAVVDDGVPGRYELYRAGQVCTVNHWIPSLDQELA